MANNFITSVDVMKYTKDTVRNQPTDTQIEGIVSGIMQTLKPGFIAISVPLDDSADYNANNKPAPRTAIAFTQKWVDIIHAHGAKVIFRGTWSGIEGIYDFSKRVGANRFPTGTADSASTDGQSTWLGKTYQYIVAHPTLFADGDIWAVLPERTEGIFADATSFLGYGGQDIQKTYPKFFLDLNIVSTQAFGKIGKKVITGMSANNFSEVKSGWLDPKLYNASDMIVVDHYGITHTVQEMETDLTNTSKKYGKPIFLQEWGDYWNANLAESTRVNYLKNMYAMFQKLADAKVLAGFNYWGGWQNSGEGVLVKSGNDFRVVSRGQLLANLFASVSAASPMTAPVPTPIPASTTENLAPEPAPAIAPIESPSPSPQAKPITPPAEVAAPPADLVVDAPLAPSLPSENLHAAEIAPPRNPAFGAYFLASVLDGGLLFLLGKTP